MEKLIITAAVVGGITLPTQTQYLPITPQQIADEAVKAAEAGAACVHVHARNPKDGSPTTDLEIYKEIITRIKDRSNVVIGITTGGGAGFSTEQRLKVVPAFKPELASCNMGSVSLSARSIAQRYKDEDYKYPWEKSYLQMLDDFVLKNTFTDLDIFMQTMRENHTKPEHEAYDVSHIYNTGYFFRKGLIDTPVWIQFVTGALGSIGALPEDILHMKHTADRLIGPDNYQWSVIGTGYPVAVRVATLAMMMGGHVRVGLEDNIFLRKGVLAKSNAEIVEKVVRIAGELDREIATPDEARAILKLKGIDKVNF
jgi:uncharacterized protein (DUF849 family)